jgi:hypothetical protein
MIISYIRGQQKKSKIEFAELVSYVITLKRWRSHQIKWCFSYTVFDITICGGASSGSRTWGPISKLPRGDFFKTTLEDLGHPQPKIPVHCDNATAVGIASKTIKRQRSRAMEMRYFWTCEKDAQKVYSFKWHPGMENLADYQSKHHPGAHHTAVRPYYLHKKNPPWNFHVQYGQAL